ncbi:hypothetical protein WMA08_13530, partial [Staphylococcus simulans]
IALFAGIDKCRFKKQVTPGDTLMLEVEITKIKGPIGKGTAKATSYGAGIIHFLGGIHEIYFPYVLMRPLLFIAVILGGMTGVATYQATGFGFKSPASPGSFIVYCLNAPRGEFLHMLLGVVLATLV